MAKGFHQFPCHRHVLIYKKDTASGPHLGVEKGEEVTYIEHVTFSDTLCRVFFHLLLPPISMRRMLVSTPFYRQGN